MTIKDIARIAGVSASTVSKIINGKTDSVSEETCERVRRVVKEYNYAPYTNALAANKSKTFVLGLMLNNGIQNREMVNAVLRQANKDGYGVMVCISDNPDDELKNAAMLLGHRVDGILWQQADPKAGSKATEKELARRGAVFYTVNPQMPVSEKNLGMDFKRAGHLATSELINAKHRKLACVHPGGGAGVEAFYCGYKQCLHERNILINEAFHFTWGEDNSDVERLLSTCTGFVCFTADIAADLMGRAQRTGYHIPRDLSVVTLEHGAQGCPEELSALRLPYAEFGSYCCRRLVAALENKRIEQRFHAAMRVEGSTVDVPFSIRGKKIVVVGALNVDTVINLGRFSDSNETLAAKSYAIMPGGRGINQAIGAAKLGADVYLVGRRGTDYDGNALMDAVLEHNIDITGVKNDPKLATGRAYIHIQDNGDSNIVIYEGANNGLSPADIKQSAALFNNAGFCLLQTDTRLDTVLCAAKLARERGVKVLLKPSFLNKLEPYTEILRYVDIFQPSLYELHQLCPGEDSMENKAQYFLDQGVGTVVVTLSEKGSYLRGEGVSEYFPAADFVPVDTTGAADAFAATLAVYLNEGKGIKAAITYANCAAGFSTTHQGVTPALADKRTLEALIPQNKNT